MSTVNKVFEIHKVILCSMGNDWEMKAFHFEWMHMEEIRLLLADFHFGTAYCSFMLSSSKSIAIHIYYKKQVWIESNQKRCAKAKHIDTQHKVQTNICTSYYKQIHALISVQGNNLHIQRHYSVGLRVTYSQTVAFTSILNYQKLLW